MSKIEVNQISSQCGSTLTIGQSGDTVTLASGATQTGFGRTGTVDWCTTAKTAPFTGVSGKGYFVNTTCAAVTVTLPATPTAGDIISIKDYARTAATNNINFCRNGSKMDGICANSGITTNGDSTTLIYVDGTKGWTSILDNTTTQYGATYVTATGGTISCCGDYKIHTFTSDGCFSVSNAGNPAGSSTVDYLVVAGGGGGGSNCNGNSGSGGAGGGFREGYNPGSYTASPLATTALPVSVTTYPITVGAGGAASSTCRGTQGSTSTFSTISSAGGAGGASGPPNNPGSNGGSGSGAGGGGTNTPEGAGNTPPVAPPQGQPGGTSRPAPGPVHDSSSGGSGGAGGAGSPSPDGATGGAGGVHVNSSISGTDTEYSGGAGGAGTVNARGTPGGGGAGGSKQNSPSIAATAGTANTGGGGGGSYGPGSQCAGAGGSGIVVIRYKFQN
jgi:hypothetical protein